MIELNDTPKDITLEAAIMIAAKAAADLIGPQFSDVYYRSSRELLNESDFIQQGAA